MKRNILLIILLFFTLAFPQSKHKKKDKVTFSGKAEIGVDFRAADELSGRIINDSRLNQTGAIETELKIFPADSVELEFDLEFDHRFTDLNLKKLFVRYNFDNSNARFGFMEKMFSLEEIKRENLFIKKSMLHNILEDFYLLSRDFTIQYRYNFPSNTLIGGFAADGSARTFVNLTLLNEHYEKTRFVIAGMYENYAEKNRKFGERESAFFANFGVEFSSRITGFELEGIWGKNVEKYGFITNTSTPSLGYLPYNERENIGFWGLRFQESFPIEVQWKHLKKITPLYEVSYFNDSFTVKNAYWQARSGMNLSLAEKDRLQWRTNWDMIMTVNNQESSSLQIISQRVLTAFVVTW